MPETCLGSLEFTRGAIHGGCLGLGACMKIRFSANRFPLFGNVSRPNVPRALLCIIHKYFLFALDSNMRAGRIWFEVGALCSVLDARCSGL